MPIDEVPPSAQEPPAGATAVTPVASPDQSVDARAALSGVEHQPGAERLAQPARLQQRSAAGDRGHVVLPATPYQPCRRATSATVRGCTSG